MPLSVTSDFIFSFKICVAELQLLPRKAWGVEGVAVLTAGEDVF